MIVATYYNIIIIYEGDFYENSKNLNKTMVLTLMASLLVASNVLGVGVSSGSANVSTTNSLGYTVKSTAKYNAYTAKARGEVSNGGPISMRVSVQGYYKKSGKVYSTGYYYDKNKGFTTTTVSTFSHTCPNMLCGSSSKVEFDAGKSV